MDKPDMSPGALARCRSLVITDISDETNPYRKRMEVKDPRQNGKVVDTIEVRTEQDFTRIKRALMQRFRIPGENLVEAVRDAG